jgi:tRNA uridine 5-carboxymethylaminomethyl modification enzyme
MISEERYNFVKNKQHIIQKEIQNLSNIYKDSNGKKVSLKQILCRPEFDYKKLNETYPENTTFYNEDINKQIEIAIKYEGYISRQEKEILKFKNLEKIKIPKDISFKEINGLRLESQEKLQKFHPENLSIASRILGVSPSDISILMIAIRKRSAKV